VDSLLCQGPQIDARTLTYKAGDEYQHAAKGRSVQQAVFLDSTGRAYSVVAHSLPSARGLGEPLSSRVDPPDGAKWRGVMIGEPEDLWLVASDAGYGFTVRLKETYAQKKAGKGLLNLPDGALVLPPAPVPGMTRWWPSPPRAVNYCVPVGRARAARGRQCCSILSKKFRRARLLTGNRVAKDKSLVSIRRTQDDAELVDLRTTVATCATRFGTAARLAHRRRTRDGISEAVKRPRAG
jgi:DNA gyrase/topoisomerase IV subunit A